MIRIGTERRTIGKTLGRDVHDVRPEAASRKYGALIRSDPMKYIPCLVVVAALCCATGCTTTTAARDYSGLSIPEGAPKAHINTTNVAIHVLFSSPLVGDATLPTAVKDCTAAAKSEGATGIRLVQSDVTTYWWVLPPISFFIHPVVANAAGDAY
ncbi:MAG: hypothetical protein ACOC8H_02355 [bacterium]